MDPPWSSIGNALVAEMKWMTDEKEVLPVLTVVPAGLRVNPRQGGIQALPHDYRCADAPPTSSAGGARAVRLRAGARSRSANTRKMVSATTIVSASKGSNWRYA